MQTDLWNETVGKIIQFLNQQKELGQKFILVGEELLNSLKPPRFSPMRTGENAGAVSQPSTKLSEGGGTNDKKAAYEKLEIEMKACVKCPHLASFRKQVVPGVGNLNADIMFVGEAPGADEDLQGEPFVGRAGQLLTRIIQTMGLRREDVFIGNILKCRPNVDTPSGNRKPTAEEMETCISYLWRQIDLIQPKVLVALGDTAVKGLVPDIKVGITKIRGQWLQCKGIPMMPTYHPAYLLRNQSLALKRQCWEDMLAAMERAGLPISDKQRGYFLNSMAP